MEFSFEYFGWLKQLNEEPFLLIFISLFGSLLFLLGIAIVRWLLGLIGLKFIANWKFLNSFMISFGITGFFGGFLILILVFLLEASNSDMSGVRLILIWIMLFICVFIFYLTNRVTLEKWFDDMIYKGVKSSHKPRKKKSKRKH